MPDEPEALALLALMRLHDSRRDARVDAAGELVLLDDQDRTRWDREAIAEGSALVERALALGGPGRTRCRRSSQPSMRARAAGGTDWAASPAPTTRLAAVDAGPVVALNRAVAVAMAHGPAAGLALVDELAAALDGYHLLHSTRADLLRSSAGATRRRPPTSARWRSPRTRRARIPRSASPSSGQRRAGRGRERRPPPATVSLHSRPPPDRPERNRRSPTVSSLDAEPGVLEGNRHGRQTHFLTQPP